VRVCCAIGTSENKEAWMAKSLTFVTGLLQPPSS
jgi:hypothetical protein